jgi:Fic family protein
MSGAPALVKAAMAHLNLVMIHPFRDGNGRMARCLQTLVLAKENVVAPVFSSIEEYLGRNTQAYYDVLADVGQGAWHPERSATPWMRFCMTAHYRQAKTLLRRYQEYGRLYRECAELAGQRVLPERSVAALMDAAIGLRIRNGAYRKAVSVSQAEEISELTATRDLKALVASNLLDPVGERRGRYYVASPELRARWTAIRNERPPRFADDPFAIVAVGDALDSASAEID